MSMQVTLDETLAQEARILGHHTTVEEAVTAALQAYIERQKRLRVLEMAGTIDYDPAVEPARVRGKA